MSEIDIEKTKVDPGAPDLDKARDEKCIPVARAIFADMVSDLLPDDVDGRTDYSQIVLKILQKNFTADMNITIESPYIFQLILGVLSGLNASIQGAMTAPIDDARYKEIGRKILAIVSDANVRMGSVTPEETAADFADAKIKLNDLFIAEKLNGLELKYVIDMIFNSFKAVNDLYSQNIERSVERGSAKLFGVESMTDLGLKRLDEVLKSQPVQPAESSEQKPEEPKAE